MPRFSPSFIASLCGVFLFFSAVTCASQDLKTGLEQLSEQIVKGIPEAKTFRIAVADFPDLLNITSNLGRYIANRLTTRFTQSQKFFVVERQRLEQVLHELRFSMSDLVNPEKAKKLGNMVGVEAILVGTISDLGNQVDIDARIIEIESSRTVLSATTTISKDQTVAQLMEQGRAAPVVVATPGNPVSLPSSSPSTSPQQMNGNDVFQNSFLKVMVKSISRSEEKQAINLVLQLENLNDTDLLIALGHHGISLLDDRGKAFSLNSLNGLTMVHSSQSRNKDYYTVFTPKSQNILAMAFRSNEASEGTVFSFSANCFRFEDKSAVRFSMGIPNIPLP